MKRQLLKIETNKQIGKDTYEMMLSGEEPLGITTPGQFINIKVPEHFLRRPISIHDYSDKTVTIWYKLAGKGTIDMSAMKPGEVLDVLLPLGNGFSFTGEAARSALLVGGGIGSAPLLPLAREIAAAGQADKCAAIFGFASKDDMLPVDKYEKLGIKVIIATEDGSYGTKGFVTDAMESLDYDFVYTCGPEPMLKAVFAKSPDGQFSFEERMGCGFGACMGCSCKTKYGNKRICKDGPVLVKDEIIW